MERAWALVSRLRILSTKGKTVRRRLRFRRKLCTCSIRNDSCEAPRQLVLPMNCSVPERWW